MWRLWDLFKLFAIYDRVRDVFIQKKVDKWGSIFGFVKFKEVLDVEDTEAKLAEVRLGRLLELGRRRGSSSFQRSRSWSPGHPNWLQGREMFGFN